MKKFIAFSFALLMIIGTLGAAVTLRYYNKDSTSYTFKVKIDGSTKAVEFDASKTSSVTIQGGATEAVISCGCGDVKVKTGDNIEIEKGCVRVK